MSFLDRIPTWLRATLLLGVMLSATWRMVAVEQSKREADNRSAELVTSVARQQDRLIHDLLVANETKAGVIKAQAESLSSSALALDTLSKQLREVGVEPLASPTTSTTSTTAAPVRRRTTVRRTTATTSRPRTTTTVCRKGPCRSPRK